MNRILEVTGEDIAQLDDSSLRELIGLLCEADYRKAGMSVREISWGGNQDASDGGLDVVVEGDSNPPKESFILSSRTGIQVKRPAMPRSAIMKEMLDSSGTLKASLSSFLRNGGAYIIACSGDSLTQKGKGYQNRIAAIEEVLETVPSLEPVECEFYDRGKIASWVRQYPGMIAWVHSKLNKRINGWRPYGDWARSIKGPDGEYFIGEEVRLFSDSKNEPLDVKSGIAEFRALLSKEKTSLRLVGLSGVGKTRFVQALFDERIEGEVPKSHLAIYADTADSPDPDPQHLVSHLISSGDRAIVIIDNCSRQLHSNLAEKIQSAESKLSLLTIEYDVREDDHETTTAFRLEPTSDSLIEKLIEEYFPAIGHTNAKIIAEMAGGNFRVALYLARTVKTGESLGVVKDDNLFTRLFQQGHEPDTNLLESAEIFSLLYSYDGESINNESELELLAQIGEKTARSLYSATETIYSRDLIQKRGQWRALLPQAVANNLAKRALKRIPRKFLLEKVLSGSERSIISFTRRIGYLHDSEQARAIVEELIAADGWLGKSLHDLNSFGFKVLNNLAPANVVQILNQLELIADSSHAESFFRVDSLHAHGFARILYHIAYDDIHFIRATRLLSYYALTEKSNNNMNSSRNRLMSLFQPLLSGSHAKPATRKLFLDELLISGSPEKEALAMQLLENTLRTGHFMGSHDSGFGAHARNYGSSFNTKGDIEEWYRPFIQTCIDVALSDNEMSHQAKGILAKSFRGLWRFGFVDDCVSFSDALTQNGSWVDGWRAVLSTLYYQKDKLVEDEVAKLKSLSNKLRPESLSDRFEYYVGGKTHHSIFDAGDEYIDDEDPVVAYERASQIAQEIGSEISQSDAVLQQFCAKCVEGESQRLFEVGVGLARSKLDNSLIWERLTEALYLLPEKERNVGALRGFIWELAAIDLELYEKLLEEVAQCPFLIHWSVAFHRPNYVNNDAVKRFHRILVSCELNWLKNGTIPA